MALVLLSALMHALWNLVAKGGPDRLLTLAALKLPNMAMASVLLVAVGLPDVKSAPFLLSSAALNAVYFYCLSRAYAGDLSLAYPLARGMAPLGVLVLSAAWVGEWPQAQALLGICLISLAVLALLGQRQAGGGHWHTAGWALAVAVCIGAYTVVDGLGARVSGNVVGYVAALNVLTGLCVGAAAWWRRGTAALVQGVRSQWKQGIAGGALMLLAYLIVVYALTLAPMAQIAALRESSVIFAALMGVAFLKEPFGRWRVAAATVLAAGIMLMATA